MRDIHEWCLLSEDADDDKSNFVAKLNNLGKDKKQLKNLFFNNLGLLFSAGDKGFNNLLFTIKNLGTNPTNEP